MANSLENRIRIQAVAVYVMVAGICGGMIYYMNDLRENINSRKENIMQFHISFTMANEFIYAVNEAQSVANLYVISKKRSHYRQYQKSLKDISIMVDSLTIQSGDSADMTVLNKIVGLLKEKGRIIHQFNARSDDYNPLHAVNEKLREFEQPVIVQDSVFVSTIVSDTTIQVAPKRNFWKRLAGAFSPEKSADTIVTVSTFHMDTIRVIQPADTVTIVSEVTSLAEEASLEYNRQMEAIEKQLNSLLTNDRVLSQQITELVNDFYKYTLETIFNEIEVNEEEIRRNYTYSIIAGISSLFLILILIVLIISDVNKGYTTRKALEKANAKIRQIMESRHKLLLSVAHDIKTPLMSILGHLQLNETEQKLADKDISSMINSGRHIQALLENLLEFSSLEQGKLQLSVSEFDPEELSREIVQMFTPLSQKKGLTLVYHSELTKGVWIRGDELKLKQIIINIVSNALKYTQEGSVRLNVSYHENILRILVEDTGAGIPATELERIFKPFVRVEQNNTIAEGSGFGMYVVKGLIDLLRGNIRIDSTVGKGTKVTMHIPAETVQEKASIISGKILVFDDDASILNLVGGMCKRLGHVVEVIRNPEEIRSHPEMVDGYEVVITDMEMGDLHGTEILSLIRKRSTATKVFVMTGRTDFTRQKAIELGFDDFLSKPFSLRALASLIGEAVPAAYNAGSLKEFYEGDEEGFHELMETFIRSTKENLLELAQLQQKDDLLSTQALCHRMLPMFMQLQADRAVVILKKMDMNRKGDETKYPDWKEDITELIHLSEELIESIQSDILFKD